MAKVQVTVFLVLLSDKLHTFELKSWKLYEWVNKFSSSFHFNNSLERIAKLPIFSSLSKTASWVKNYELHTRYRCLSVQKGSDYEF